MSIYNGEKKNWRKARHERDKKVNSDVRTVLRAISERGNGKQKKVKLSFFQRELLSRAHGAPKEAERGTDERDIGQARLVRAKDNYRPPSRSLRSLFH